MNAATASTVELRGELIENAAMSRFTSWAVGGPADRLYRPADKADLAAFLSSLDANEPLTFVGLGSNLLVRDGGIRGTVVLMRSCLNALSQKDGMVYAEAGVTCAKLARQTADWSFHGGAFFAGIPGSLGGALAMNAGAHGGETWAVIDSVETIDRAGCLYNRSPEEFEIAYRHVGMPVQDEWFIAAKLRFNSDENGVAMDEIRSLLAHRSETQPINQRSCGSVFRNPQGDYSARLIESCGLKGHRIGGAEVSEKHANFIVNADKASAADIEQLIGHVHNTVEEQCGVSLHAEVRVIGEAL
jgi:UDP-N-acetylmuramate dehydrogenase